jgi:NAD(P)-dependent dehydrogenase (short-subunit alcohol dehydrogenase family)
MSLLIVFGYGPGISHATASRFGREGYSLALVGRDAERLAQGVERLTAEGLEAKAFQSDASDADSILRTVTEIRSDLGTVSALLWTAFGSGGVTDVLTTRPEDVARVLDVGVAGLLACTQALLDDLKASPGAAVLVANGAFGESTPQMDAASKLLNRDGMALANAAKSKLVGLLAERLRDFDIYVGEVTIAGSVAGTATARPGAIEPTTIAETFWSLTQSRDATRVRLT